MPADETIVYDDGSVDDSLAILKTFGGRIRVLCGPGGTGTPMQNQAQAIAAAFAESKGRFVFLLDSDDAFGSEHIASYMKAFGWTTAEPRPTC